MAALNSILRSVFKMATCGTVLFQMGLNMGFAEEPQSSPTADAGIVLSARFDQTNDYSLDLGTPDIGDGNSYTNPGVTVAQTPASNTPPPPSDVPSATKGAAPLQSGTTPQSNLLPQPDGSIAPQSPAPGYQQPVYHQPYYAPQVQGQPTAQKESDWPSLRNLAINEDWKLSVGAALRYRYMDEKNRLRPGGPGRSTYDLWRFNPFASLKYYDVFEAYVEGIDASSFNEDLPMTPIDENRADLLQYYIDVKLAEIFEGSLRAKVGRQFLKYGSQQLLSPLAWSNTFRNFEGAKLYYQGDSWDVDGFITRPVNAATGNIFRPRSADHADQSRWLSGIYATYKDAPFGVLDLYWIYLSEDEAVPVRMDGERHTIGFRWDGKDDVKGNTGKTAGTWFWEVAGAYQFGQDNQLLGGPANVDVSASFISLMGGYTFSDLPWTPSVKALVWSGSGDDNPLDNEINTFTTLFPLGHAYWGLIDNLSGQNLNDYSLQLTLKPTKKLNLLAAYHYFNKERVADAVYNVANVGLIPTVGSPKHIGQEIDLIATYKFHEQFSVQGGATWFFYGDAIDQSPLARDDAEFYYLTSTISF